MREPGCCWTDRTTPNGKGISWGRRLGLISSVYMSLYDVKHRRVVIKSHLWECFFSLIIANVQIESKIIVQIGCSWTKIIGICSKSLLLRWTSTFVGSRWSHYSKAVELVRTSDQKASCSRRTVPFLNIRIKPWACQFTYHNIVSVQQSTAY